VLAIAMVIVACMFLPFLPGTREIVMYNKRDEHFAISHDSDILRLATAVRSIGGYYAVNNAATPHWKYFLFD